MGLWKGVVYEAPEELSQQGNLSFHAVNMQQSSEDWATWMGGSWKGYNQEWAQLSLQSLHWNQNQ